MNPIVTRKFDVISTVSYSGVAVIFLAALFLHGGTLNVLWDPAAILIAIFGSLCGTLVTISQTDLRNLRGIVRKVFVYEHYNIDALVEMITDYAFKARKDGILSLEQASQNIEDKFFRRGIMMAVDGTSPDVIKTVMMGELRAMQERHETGKRIIDTWATFAPAFGMMGTIMALCMVLLKLDNPKAIGPGMALALLSTFYGVLACYAIFTPMAKKLERRSREEVFVRRLIVHGVLALQEGQSPKNIQRQLAGLVKKTQEWTVEG